MRRVRDLHFERLREPRYLPNVDYPLATILGSLVASMVTRAPSLRGAELRTAQISRQHNAFLGIDGRIADNTFGKILPRLEPRDVRRRLVAMVKAEHRRGNLQSTAFPVPTVAVDGKNVASLRWHDLCRVLKLKPKTATVEQVRKLLRMRFPDLQLCVPELGLPYALARVHTVTLISSAAACCVYQRPIPGRTNEIGTLSDLLSELHRAYGRMRLFEMVTTDAGNTSLKVATLIVKKLRRHYFSQIKSEHGELHAEAERALGMRKEATAEASYADKQNGKTATYHVWRYDLSNKGWLDWRHARQLVRVQKVTEDPTTGEKTVGNRYYVSSKTTTELSANDALRISRMHWRCEEETHWTTDAILQEDRRRLSWSRHPVGVFVVSLLRMMALNILAVARRLSRFGHSNETPTWHQVAEHFLLMLCATTLNTEAFDAVND
jgi:predicted transposase YbfD/YdcC